MLLHAARRRTINTVGRPNLPTGRRTFEPLRGAADLARTENDRGRLDPSAEWKERAFCLSAINKKAQSEKICCAFG